MKNTYTMTISRLTVDKLGVKLYDRVSAVIAELVANSYDADATEVIVEAPMDELLASKSQGVLVDKQFAIVVSDNGSGMTPEEVNQFYLKVGSERRRDPKRGDQSKKLKRKVMGRKGVGKLAPFGVCEKIEVITSGGDPVEGPDEHGAKIKGYLTAHLVLERKNIMSDTDDAYHPVAGKLDGVIRKHHGTVLRMTIFDHRRVPAIEDFERQLAQRFGLQSNNWKIVLRDSNKTATDPAHTRVVGSFSIKRMPSTTLTLKEVKTAGASTYPATDEDGNVQTDIQAGFLHDGRFYPVTGWVAYADAPYKDDLMAGIRIYCRGKIAAQTQIFNMKAGFTGEHDVRSYLVGELTADWLDEADDLIRTDRQDILWSNELGQEFESWGQTLVKKIGKLTRGPRKKKAWELFEQKSGIHELVKKAFPQDSQSDLRDNTLEIAKAIASTTREEDLKDDEHVQSVIDLSLLLGPHITLDRKLREAADEVDAPMAVISNILKVARLAELAAFGRIAQDRIAVVKKVEELKDDPATLESAFQELLTNAPWLINPQWSPITANQGFTTLRDEFVKFFKKETGIDLNLNNFSDPTKRCDFVMSSQDNSIQIIEIKKPSHSLMNEEMERIQKYIDLMKEFLEMPGHEEFKAQYPTFHITVVCDKLALKGTSKGSFEGYKNSGILELITWAAFLKRTRKMHEDFLNLADKQRKNASKI